jgi:hypothetical protein
MIHGLAFRFLPPARSADRAPLVTVEMISHGRNGRFRYRRFAENGGRGKGLGDAITRVLAGGVASVAGVSAWIS